MRFHALPLDGAYLVEPEPFADRRGMFSRVFCSEEFARIGHAKEFVPVNHSRTVRRGAVRGMHYQRPPCAEVKLVKCIKGAVFDVLVDLRASSSTFLAWHGEVLSAENMKAMYVPEGVAHGFQVLEQDSELLYFHTASYSPAHEGTVSFDDPAVSIRWPQEVTELSDKDRAASHLAPDWEGIEP